MKLLFHTSTLTLTVKQLSLSTASGIHLNIVSLKIVILGIESRVVFPSFWLSSCVHFPTLLITILRSSVVLIVAVSNINIWMTTRFHRSIIVIASTTGDGTVMILTSWPIWGHTTWAIITFMSRIFIVVSASNKFSAMLNRALFCYSSTAICRIVSLLLGWFFNIYTVCFCFLK